MTTKFACLQGNAHPFPSGRDKSTETERFFGLADQWMAAELLRLCRHVRESGPDDVVGRWSGTAESRMLWDIVPEIAARLGASRFLSDERTEIPLRNLDAFDLRQIVTCVFSRVRRCDRISDEDGIWDLLTRDVAQGNHMAIALDRVAPAIVPGDFISATLHEAWSTRGHGGKLSWSPDLAKAS